MQSLVLLRGSQKNCIPGFCAVLNSRSFDGVAEYEYESKKFNFSNSYSLCLCVWSVILIHTFTQQHLVLNILFY